MQIWDKVFVGKEKVVNLTQRRCKRLVGAVEPSSEL